MATYIEIQNWVKQKYNFVPKTCWIAHVKELSGLPVEKAPNRKGDERMKPCPPEKIEQIRSAMRNFGMIE
jgi:hypothetical protein